MRKQNRTSHVAIIVDAVNPYDRKIIAGIAAFVKEIGSWSLYVEVDPLDKLPDLSAWDGQGIIANFDDRKVAQAVAGLRVPVVGVGGGYGWYDPAGGIPYFATDNEGIARLAADHLLERGFRRLAFYGCPRTRTNGWSEERMAAFSQRAGEAGRPCSVYLGQHESPRRWGQLQRGLAGWLGTLEKPVGLMACNDIRARHVLEACRSLSLRVPEDLALVGVDNDELICELTNPPLSSVEQGARRMGYQAAALLEQLMRGKRAGQQRFVVPPEGVVTRRSSDILAIEDAEVAAAVHFIHAHAQEDIDLADVVAAVGMSRSSIVRRFKAVVGRSIREQIELVRLRHAQRLIADTALPLKRVAKLSGFRYLPYFARRFSLAFGLTPSEFRRRAAQQGATPSR
jgi:LacI family transcriptional regulator